MSSFIVRKRIRDLKRLTFCDTDHIPSDIILETIEIRIYATTIQKDNYFFINEAQITFAITMEAMTLSKMAYVKYVANKLYLYLFTII